MKTVEVSVKDVERVINVLVWLNASPLLTDPKGDDINIVIRLREALEQTPKTPVKLSLWRRIMAVFGR